MPRNKVAWRRLVFVVLIIASLAVLTVSFRETESGPVHSVQQATAGLLAPLQSWGARVAQPFQDGYDWVTTLWSAHKDAERLAAQVQELQGEVVKLQEQAEENQRLKGLLDFRDKGTFPTGTSFLVARVTGKVAHALAGVGRDRQGLRRRARGGPGRGRRDPAGRRDRLPARGWWARSIEVTAHSAKVQLITDSESSVAAKIQGRGPRA